MLLLSVYFTVGFEEQQKAPVRTEAPNLDYFCKLLLALETLRERHFGIVRVPCTNLNSSKPVVASQMALVVKNPPANV